MKGAVAGAAAAAVATVAIEELRPRAPVVVEVEKPPPPAPPEYSKPITLTVNGEKYSLRVGNNWTLAETLREKLGLVGTKIGCGRGTCGACTVIVDGRAAFSCLMLAVEAEGKDIETIEGLSDEITLHPLQQSFLERHAFQCGFCTPGTIMSAKALLDRKPSPTLEEVKEALSGHQCSCGELRKPVEAVLAVGK